MLDAKKPAFACELLFEYGGEGGIDSLRSPLLGPSMGLTPSGPTQALFKNAPGVFVRAARSLRFRSVQRATARCRTPVGGSHPPRWVLHAKKKPAFACELLFEYGGEGGLTRFARPKGQPASCASGLSNGQLPVVEPRSEVLIPPAGCYMRKKSPHLHASFSSNMAVRGGFEPPIRCRIHTFQACSFSHSDTSPYCLPSIAGTALM